MNVSLTVSAGISHQNSQDPSVSPCLCVSLSRWLCLSVSLSHASPRPPLLQWASPSWPPPQPRLPRSFLEGPSSPTHRPAVTAGKGAGPGSCDLRRDSALCLHRLRLCWRRVGWGRPRDDEPEGGGWGGSAGKASLGEGQSCCPRVAPWEFPRLLSPLCLGEIEPLLPAPKKGKRSQWDRRPA